MPLVGTVDIAVYVMLRSLLLDTALHDAVSHQRRAVPAGDDHRTRGHARQPALPGTDDRPLLHRQHRRRHADARAGAGAPRSRSPAGVGNLKVTAFSGAADDAAWVYMDIMEGSYGGRHGTDGMDAVDTLYANTRNNPIEDIESHYPLRVRRYELATSGAGARAVARRPGLDPRLRVPGRRRVLARGRRQQRAAARTVRRRRRDARVGGDEPRHAHRAGACRRRSPTARSRPARCCGWSAPAAAATAIPPSATRGRPGATPRTACACNEPAGSAGARRASPQRWPRPRRSAPTRMAASRGSRGPRSCSRPPNASPTGCASSVSTVEIDAAGNLIAKWDGPRDRGGDGRLAPRHGPARRPVRRRPRGAGRGRGGPPAARRAASGRRGRSGSGRSWTRRAPASERRCSAAARSAARTCPRRWTPATGTGSRFATRWPRTGTRSTGSPRPTRSARSTGIWSCTSSRVRCCGRERAA